MASPSHLPLHWKEQVEVFPAKVLDALPFPAAVIGANGSIDCQNDEWTTACTDAYNSGPAQAGAKAILAGRTERFSQELPEHGTGFRVTITPLDWQSETGALVVVQKLGASPPPEMMPGSEKMATVGRLLGGVVHDFANLLTMISGYSEILLNRISQDDRLREEVDEIRKAANRGSRLTSQLLGFSRGQTPQTGVVDLNEIVNGIVRMLRPIIGEHLDMSTVFASDLAKTVADPGQIEQVLMNLVLNARDAMPQGGRISIETRNIDVNRQMAEEHSIAPGSYAMFCVSDMGQGIEPGMLDRLWQPFFTTKPEGKGTGLGLNTVQKIVQANGGAVWVHSVVGRGTTFFVCLPSASAICPPAPPRTAPMSLPLSAASEKSGNETVLIVEDEAGVRRLLRHVLESRGYKVLEASDGEEALEVYQSSGHSIHLVLTDMIMPRMGGRELASRLTRLSGHVKIVFMSGYTDDVLLHTGELGRGMSFLQKPLRPETLAAKVREALDAPSRPFNPH